MRMPTPSPGLKTSDYVNRLMFDFDLMSEADVIGMCEKLPRKIIRWIGVHHPDNQQRLIFFKLTGIEIGENTVINANMKVYDDYRELVFFGARVAVAADVTIIASSSPNNSRLTGETYVQKHLISSAPVRIHDDSWLGAGSILLPGVTIGERSVVAAGAVVSRDVPPSTVVAGVPARKIRVLGVDQ